jgi:hypothetical protein
MRSFFPAFACVGFTSTCRRVISTGMLAVSAVLVTSVAATLSPLMPLTTGNVSRRPMLPAGSANTLTVCPANAAATSPLGV